MSGYVRGASLRSGIFQTRRGPAESVAAIVLGDGEPGYEVDTGRFVVGDGVTPWSGLPSEGHGTASDIGVSDLTSLVGSTVQAVFGDVDARLPLVENSSAANTAAIEALGGGTGAAPVFIQDIEPDFDGTAQWWKINEDGSVGLSFQEA